MSQAALRVDQLPSILPQLVARIVDVLHPVQVWLFGSRARGEARADSDWDFLAILPDDAPNRISTSARCGRGCEIWSFSASRFSR